MKKLIFVLTIGWLVSSCTAELEEQNAQLQSENDSLRQEVVQQDSTISDFLNAFNTIQSNLADIRSREEAIQTAREEGLEMAADARENVISDIEAINSLLEENRSTISSLQAKLKGSNSAVARFKKMVENLNYQVQVKDGEINLLKEDLAALNFKVGQLNTKVGLLTEETAEQKALIAKQRESLNQAFYSIGTYKELKEAQVVDKEGGFIGIGRTKTLADDFNREYFTEIDLSKTDRIPLNLENDKARLITKHASDSYEWERSEDKIIALKISDPKLFWKSSKYLVVLID
jgi:DNA repair exonuclease SbcCD ATPase subunit